MKKIILMALSIASISSLLFACQSKENTTKASVNPTVKPESDKILTINNDYKSIRILRPSFNEITFDNKEHLRAFQEIFSGAIKEPGIVNMNNPKFYMDVVYDNNNHQSLYLWIGEKGQRSAFMKTEDTHTIYTVSIDMTDKLIELVESRFN